MMTIRMMTVLAALVMVRGVFAQETATRPATQPQKALGLVAAVRIGSAGDDTMEDVAYGADGSIYLVGNAGGELVTEGLAGGRAIGEAVPKSAYGRGYVAQIDADGRRVLHGVTFAPGLVKLTSVAVTKDAVYVSGYATGPAEGVFKPGPGVFKTIPTKAPEGKLYTPKEHYDEPKFAPGTDQRGAPFVLRLKPDLSAITASTFLEGWQSLWHVPEPLNEDHYQPVALTVLSDGDVVLGHDGGYNVGLKPGQEPALENFYAAGDYLSRLSGDLGVRRWKVEVLTPEVDPKLAAQGIKAAEWPHATMGNTRIFRVRRDAKDKVYVSGWSASRTTQEPWWSPFLRKYDGAGKVIWKAWEFDPTSGRDHRLNGLVSDGWVRSVAVDDEDGVLTSMVGDGGNNVLLHDPRDYNMPATNRKGTLSSFRGRVLFWGGVARLDSQTRELQAGNVFNAYGQIRRGWGKGGQGLITVWANDLCALPGGRVLAVGRNYENFEVSKDAWYGPAVGSFVRVFDREFNVVYTASLPDADLTTMARRGRRTVAVGTAWTEKTPVTEGGVSAKGLKGRDGYVVIMEAGEAADAR